ncbi:hypothetical protein DUI87_30205 [Hirundo rustica rustica]|uniref:Copper transport protein n=1 Tax=Hirundo rustica rustica TaxID=333673 RepID=A0A3M0IXM4_HIRRU|nr:hypothetical protein DUI87_30205 [Hirundo rustica rustica]
MREEGTEPAPPRSAAPGEPCAGPPRCDTHSGDNSDNSDNDSDSHSHSDSDSAGTARHGQAGPRGRCHRHHADDLLFSDTVVLLFDFWNVHSPTGMVLSVLVILLLSVLYEAVKMGKAVLLRRALLALPRSLSQEALTEPREGDSDPAQGRWFWFHVGQTLFHVVQVVLGYMVMLAVMSYNAWIFLGAIAGSTLGYFMVYPLLGRG